MPGTSDMESTLNMVSVIIPTYNYGHYIGEALDFIIAQTHTNWEVIVIDDGSTDNTETVVKKYADADPRIKYFRQTNAGPSAARNNGIARMKGDFVQFLDPDDLFEKRKFEVQLKIFEDNPLADIVYSNLRYFERNPYDPADRKFSFWGVDEDWLPQLQGKGSSFLPQALKGNFTHFSGMLFRRSIVDKAGLFDEIHNAPSDYTFILHCVINDAFFIYHDTPDTYGLIRWHPNSLSRNLDRMMSEEIKVRQELTPLLRGNKEAELANEHAIKAYTLKLRKSWKQAFLSGGPFDFAKKGLKAIGLDKVMRKIFYK